MSRADGWGSLMKRTKLLLRFVAVAACFAVAVSLAFCVVRLAAPEVCLPAAVTSDSSCPATRCAGGACHGFDDVPAPSDVYEMSCPEATCSSIGCHAWDELLGRYGHASGASMALWIFLPVGLTVGLLVALRKVGGDE